jgi:hypothetical protein
LVILAKSPLLRDRGCPPRHAAYLELLINLSTLVNAEGGRLVLIKGALLGAFRQDSFAGRPSDLDIAILPPRTGESWITNFQTEFLQCSWMLRTLPTPPHRGDDSFCFACRPRWLRFAPRSLSLWLDISILHLVKTNSGLSLTSNNFSTKQGIPRIEVSLDADFTWPTVSIYGNNFFALPQTETYLAQIYGSDWRTPRGRQWP